MLLHAGGRRRRARPPTTPARLWYPLWDAGFVLGQSVRTVKEALASPTTTSTRCTALLDVRLVAGDARARRRLDGKVRRLAPRRRDRLIDALADRGARRGWSARDRSPRCSSPT